MKTKYYFYTELNVNQKINLKSNMVLFGYDIKSLNMNAPLFCQSYNSEDFNKLLNQTT